jgi:glycosyltransferase involved in cell wall biosynthesis
VREQIILSIIIPAFNEATSIGDVLSRVCSLGLSSTEILVVSDGSSDRTVEIAKSFDEVAKVRVLEIPCNMGNGAAVKVGLRASRGEFVIFLDGDGQHNPEDIPNLLAQGLKYPMVVGSRQFGLSGDLIRNCSNLILSKIASIVCSYQVKDITSGFRFFYRRDAMRFCDMLPNGFSYATTITLCFLRSGRPVGYVPISAGERRSKSKVHLWKDGPRFLLVLFKILGIFSPMRIFAPLSAVCFVGGLSRYLYTFYSFHKFTNMSLLLFISSLLFFLVGILSEQIAQRYFIDNFPDRIVDDSFDNSLEQLSLITERVRADVC